ncbi:MAG: universal stress protein [Haloferacaceae archaeon]|jgi:nucleotide-binding universal stress UspA family protein
MDDKTRSFSFAVVPVASPEDGAATGAAVARYAGAVDRVLGVSVVEKGGGAPDKLSVEQAEAHAEEALAALAGPLREAGIEVETEVDYGTDVVETLVEAAGEAGADIIAFTPREGGGLLRLLSGDLGDRLVHESDVPVLAVPKAEQGDDPEATGE